MTIDKAKLRALAEAATQGVWLYDGSTLNDWEAGSYSMEWMPNGEDCEDGANANFKADGAYMAAANPATVLALLDEVERLKGCDKAYEEVWKKARDLQSEMDEVVDQRDQLKAENEGLRAALHGESGDLSTGSHGENRDLSTETTLMKAYISAGEREHSLREKLAVALKDAERFEYIARDAERTLEKIYGDDWLAVIDENIGGGS